MRGDYSDCDCDFVDLFIKTRISCDRGEGEGAVWLSNLSVCLSNLVSLGSRVLQHKQQLCQQRYYHCPAPNSSLSAGPFGLEDGPDLPSPFLLVRARIITACNTMRGTATCIRLVTIDAWQGAEQLHDVDMTTERCTEQSC